MLVRASMPSRFSQIAVGEWVGGGPYIAAQHSKGKLAAVWNHIRAKKGVPKHTHIHTFIHSYIHTFVHLIASCYIRRYVVGRVNTYIVYVYCLE